MKKKLTALFTVVTALVLSLVLVGCGGGGKDAKEVFAGNWKATSMTGFDEDDWEFCESLGMSIVLTLEDDGTATISIFGESMDGTWEAKSTTECSITLDGDEGTATLKDDVLTLGVDEDTVTFTKISDDEAEELLAANDELGDLDEEGDDESTDAIVDENFEPMTVADDDICTLEVTGKQTDDWGDSGYLFTVKNKTDKTITFSTTYETSTVDGTMVEFYGSKDVNAGAQAKNVFFYCEGDEVPSLDDLKNVVLVVEIWDADTWDTLASYTLELN